MNHLLKKYNLKKDHYEKKNLLKIIDAKVYYAVEDILQFAEIKLGRKMPERIKVGIAMHVNAMTERISKGGRAVDSGAKRGDRIFYYVFVRHG